MCFGGLSPAKAAKRRHEKQAARKAEQQGDTETRQQWESPAVAGRFTASQATKLTKEELDAVHEALLAKAKRGDAAAARALLSFIKLGLQIQEEAPDLNQHAEPSDERHRTFEFGLDLVLDGLEKLRDRA